MHERKKKIVMKEKKIFMKERSCQKSREEDEVSTIKRKRKFVGSDGLINFNSKLRKKKN